MQIVLNAVLIFANLLAMSTMIIYWVNYKRGIVPTFLRVFDMISGEISPKAIGLTSEAQVVSLVRRVELMFKVIQLFIDRIIVVLGVFYCVPAFPNSSTIEFLVYVIPNTIWYEFLLHYFYNYLFYKMAYLYLMCSYLKMKIRSVDEEMKQSIKHRRRSLMVIIKKLYDIFDEINEYNTTYWSKYLFGFWLIFGTITFGCLSVAIKGSMDTTMTILWLFLAFHLSLVFLLVILTTASVNSGINRMYSKCNSLFIQYFTKTKGKQNLRFQLRTMNKVIHIKIIFLSLFSNLNNLN